MAKPSRHNKILLIDAGPEGCKLRMVCELSNLDRQNFSIN